MEDNFIWVHMPTLALINSHGLLFFHPPPSFQVKKHEKPIDYEIRDICVVEHIMGITQYRFVHNCRTSDAHNIVNDVELLYHINEKIVGRYQMGTFDNLSIKKAQNPLIFQNTPLIILPPQPLNLRYVLEWLIDYHLTKEPHVRVCVRLGGWGGCLITLEKRYMKLITN